VATKGLASSPLESASTGVVSDKRPNGDTNGWPWSAFESPPRRAAGLWVSKWTEIALQLDPAQIESADFR